MNTSSSCLILLACAVTLLLLVNTASAAPKKLCVFKCLRGVIKCKRESTIPGLLPAGIDCCAKYTDCYLRCDPTATNTPSCSHNKSKRGSWNKRGGVVPVLDLAGRFQPRSEFDAPHPDPLQFLFDDSDDFE